MLLWSACIGNETKFQGQQIVLLYSAINFCYFCKKIAAYSSLFY